MKFTLSRSRIGIIVRSDLVSLRMFGWLFKIKNVKTRGEMYIDRHTKIRTPIVSGWRGYVHRSLS